MTTKLEKLFIILLEKRQGLSPKTKQAKTLAKINQMLFNFKKEPSTSALNSKGRKIIYDLKKNHLTLIPLSMKLLFYLEKKLEKIDLENLGLNDFLQIKANPMSLTKNCCSRLTPPDLQFEE